MSETRKIAAILVSDVVGYSRLAGADEDRILSRLRTLRRHLIVPLLSLRPGPDTLKEHRRADPGLLASSRRSRAGETCNAQGAARAEKAFGAVAVRCSARRVACPDRRRHMVVPECEPACCGRFESAGRGR